jgi:hypothetical protein
MSIDDSAAREEVCMNRLKRLSILVVLFLAAFIPTVFAGEHPLAIFHAFIITTPSLLLNPMSANSLTRPDISSAEVEPCSSLVCPVPAR